MSTVSFKNVSGLYYGGIPLIGAIHDNKRLWPPTTQSYTLGADPTQSPPQDIYVFAGDVFTLAAPNNTWRTGNCLAIFKVEGDKWTGNYIHPSSGFVNLEANLDGVLHYPGLMDDGQFPLVCDTKGMDPGEYVIARGENRNSPQGRRHYFFKDRWIQYRLHVRPQFPKGRPGRFTIDFRTLNWKKRYTALAAGTLDESDPDYACPVIKVPANTEQLFFIADGDDLYVQAMWVYKTNNRVFFGYNPDLSSPGDGNSIQTRQGGPWNLDPTVRGDRLFVGTGIGATSFQLDACILDFI
jgi:hypothetical protein